MILKQLLYSVLFLSIPFTGTAQQFDNQIDALNTLGMKIISNESDEDKLVANDKYKEQLKEVLNDPNSFGYSFDSLKTISILQKAELKVYNWAVPLQDGTFLYCAFLHIKNSDDTYKVVELVDKSETISKPEYKTLNPKNWYGALYYKLIHNKKIGKNTYTLLGWDGNNLLTNKKIIEVITINKGMVKIGASIFKTPKNKRAKKRIIFEYSENVVMSLKYHNKSKQIIFDYLVPSSSKLKGIYEYYGPALNRFDALLIDKKRWIYIEDVDIEANKSIKDFMWNKPEKVELR